MGMGTAGMAEVGMGIVGRATWAYLFEELAAGFVERLDTLRDLREGHLRHGCPAQLTELLLKPTPHEPLRRSVRKPCNTLSILPAACEEQTAGYCEGCARAVGCTS